MIKLLHFNNYSTINCLIFKNKKSEYHFHITEGSCLNQHSYDDVNFEYDDNYSLMENIKKLVKNSAFLLQITLQGVSLHKKKISFMFKSCLVVVI